MYLLTIFQSHRDNSSFVESNIISQQSQNGVKYSTGQTATKTATYAKNGRNIVSRVRDRVLWAGHPRIASNRPILWFSCRRRWLVPVESWVSLETRESASSFTSACTSCSIWCWGKKWLGLGFLNFYRFEILDLGAKGYQGNPHSIW